MGVGLRGGWKRVRAASRLYSILGSQARVHVHRRPPKASLHFTAPLPYVKGPQDPLSSRLFFFSDLDSHRTRWSLATIKKGVPDVRGGRLHDNRDTLQDRVLFDSEGR